MRRNIYAAMAVLALALSALGADAPLPPAARELFDAISREDAAAAKDAVAKGAAINAIYRAPGGAKLTPLMYAACEGKANAVKFLLSMGADVNVKDDHGNTAQDWAKTVGQPRIAGMLDAAAFLADSRAPAVSTPPAAVNGNVEARLAAIENRLTALEQRAAEQPAGPAADAHAGNATGAVEDKIAGLKLPSVQLRPNVVCGYVLNSAGKPIAESFGAVQIRIWRRGFQGDIMNYAVPDDKGYYECKVDEAGYFVEGYLRVPREQKMLVLRLRPVQTKTNQYNTAQGVRVDFVWSISGQKPWTAGDAKKGFEHYGMHIDLRRDTDVRTTVFPKSGAKYVLDFIPAGRLLDGSEGKTITIECKTTNPYDDLYANDLPLGDYIVEGKQVDANGSRQLWLRDRIGPKRDTWFTRFELAVEASDIEGPQSRFLWLTDVDLNNLPPK